MSMFLTHLRGKTKYTMNHNRLPNFAKAITIINIVWIILVVSAIAGLVASVINLFTNYHHVAS